MYLSFVGIRVLIDTVHTSELGVSDKRVSRYTNGRRLVGAHNLSPRYYTPLAPISRTGNLGQGTPTRKQSTDCLGDRSASASSKGSPYKSEMLRGRRETNRRLPI